MTVATPLAAAAGDGLARTVVQAAGIAVLAGALAGATALVHRWYVRERVPMALPVLVGLTVVAVYLNATTAIGQALGRTTLFGLRRVAVDGATLLVGLATSWAGTRIGDHVAAEVFVATGGDAVDADAGVGRMVRAVGRVIAVELPEEIDDIVGYDPVPPATKETLQGRTFLFPRRLTVAELRDRLVTRLKSDYGVGYVDLEIDDDGTVEFLALGSRVAGIGPTLPPETAAVAIRADPAHSASAGDLVQVWTADPPERVLNAEVRATAGDVVTLAVDVSDTLALDDETTYKLVTLPVETRPDREFASLLRAADETMAAVPVEAESAVEGQPLGALGVSVVAVRDAADDVDPLPTSDRVLVGGDTLYVVARPEALRRLETAASERVEGTTPSAPEQSPTPETVTAADRAAGDEAATAQEAGDDGTTSVGVTGSDHTTGPEAASTGDAASADPTSAEGAASADASADTGDEDDESNAPADVMTTSEPGPSVADERPTRTDDETTDADGSGAERAEASGDETADDGAVGDAPADATQADAATFEELKAEMDDEETSDASTDDGERPASGDESDDSPTIPDDVTAGKADAATFEELKAEMGDEETDEAVTDDATGPDGDVPADATQADAATFEELKAEMGDEETDEAADTTTADGSDGADDSEESEDVSGSGDSTFQELKAEFESGDADSFDEDSTGDDPFGDDPLDAANHSADDAVGGDDAGGEDDDAGGEDDDAGSGGGGTSFADLKDEFESGDADWDDDVEIGGMALEPESEEEKELAEKAEQGEIGTLDDETGSDDTADGTDDGGPGETDGRDGEPGETGGGDDGVAGGLAEDDLFDDTVEGDDEFGDPFADEEVDDDLDDLDELDDIEDDPLFDDE